MEALFRAHWAPAHRAAFLIVHDAAAAEDIAQEAFLAAIRALDRFDRAPAVRSLAAPDRREPGDRLVARAGAAARGGRAGRARGAARPRRSGGRTRSWPRSRALDPDQRAAVVLRHLLEYTPGEIAQLLELPRGTVNSRLRRALDRLAAELAEEPVTRRPSSAACATSCTPRGRRGPPRRERRAWHVVRAAHAARAPARAARRGRAARRRGRRCRGRAARCALTPGRREDGRLDRRRGQPRAAGHPLRRSRRCPPRAACWWSADGGAWLVRDDGARRQLGGVQRRHLVARRAVRGGRARAASWSRSTPQGHERWTRPATGR